MLTNAIIIKWSDDYDREKASEVYSFNVSLKLRKTALIAHNRTSRLFLIKLMIIIN